MCKRGVRNERQINTKSSGLRAFMCSLSVGTIVAEVSTDVKAGDTEQSSWMDRTDIGIGIQGSQKDDYRDYKTAVNPRHITTPAVYPSEHSAKQKINIL